MVHRGDAEDAESLKIHNFCTLCVAAVKTDFDVCRLLTFVSFVRFVVNNI